MKKNFLKTLLREEQTVFSFKELLMLYKDESADSLKSKLHYFVKAGDLYHIRRGLYAIDAQYDRLELATKICIPSYISLETVLATAGIIFQYYSSIFVITYQTRTIVCDGATYIMKAIKPTILTNGQGISIKKQYSIATPERAFLDTIYLNTDYHFDNLEPLNWEKVYELLPLYEDHKKIRMKVDRYHDAFNKGI